MTAFVREGLTPLDTEGDGGRDPVDREWDLAAGFTEGVLTSDLENPSFCVRSEVSSTELPFIVAFPFSSQDTSVNKSLADFCKGILAPSKDNLLNGGVTIPERGKDEVLLILSVKSILLFKALDDTFPPVLLGHRC